MPSTHPRLLVSRGFFVAEGLISSVKLPVFVNKPAGQ
jgi:hypothetical protein